VLVRAAGTDTQFVAAPAGRGDAPRGRTALKGDKSPDAGGVIGASLGAGAEISMMHKRRRPFFDGVRGTARAAILALAFADPSRSPCSGAGRARRQRPEQRSSDSCGCPAEDGGPQGARQGRIASPRTQIAGSRAASAPDGTRCRCARNANTHCMIRQCQGMPARRRSHANRRWRVCRATRRRGSTSPVGSGQTSRCSSYRQVSASRSRRSKPAARVKDIERNGGRRRSRRRSRDRMSEITGNLVSRNQTYFTRLKIYRHLSVNRVHRSSWE